jgi:hypothetical protein
VKHLCRFVFRLLRRELWYMWGGSHQKNKMIDSVFLLGSGQGGALQAFVRDDDRNCRQTV